MEIVFPIALMLGAVLAGAISPGPSFVLVAKVAMGASRNEGVATSIGMGVGAAIFTVLSLMGLQAVLTNIPALYFFLKIIGGSYLVYIGIRIWKGANEPLSVANEYAAPQSTLRRSFLIGLITQISNPKTAIVYASIFAALLPPTMPNSVRYLLPFLVFLIEAGWYLVVTFTLSADAPRSAYLQSKSLFDRAAGSVMAVLGVKLIFSNTSQ